MTKLLINNLNKKIIGCNKCTRLVSFRKKIAKEKMKDLNAHDINEAVKIICGSARSMGIEVKE